MGRACHRKLLPTTKYLPMPASDHYLRPLGMMHKVFAGSAFVLFGSTIIMMVVDEDREWRHYQAEAERLSHLRLQEEFQQFFEPEYVTRVLDEHTGGTVNHRLLIWSLLCFEHWLHRFVR